MQPALPQWSAQNEPWQTIARQMNRIVDAVNTDSSLMAADGFNTHRLHNAGSTISPQHRNIGYPMVVVNITAVDAGGGKYSGHLFSGNSTAVASTNITMPEGLRDSGNANALIVNLAESAAGHRLLIGSFHIGLKAGMTAESPPRMIVLIDSPGPVLFPVRISKDGGADGTQTAPATWTYTVTSIDGVITWGTQQPLARPRPNGSMLPQTASPAFALAFQDAGGILRLWDAGEVQNTTACQ
jgi:hypothetical protein